MSHTSALALAAELSLREPQRKALEKFDAILSSREGSLADRKLDDWLSDAIDAVQPAPFQFDQTDYPSLAFQLATAVGKTRLLGATVLHLNREKGIKTFLVVAPSKNIYEKLKADFTPGTRKFVFAGIGHVPTYKLVTGENYQWANSDGSLEDPNQIVICVFNIQKLFESRKGLGRTFLFRLPNETNGVALADILERRNDLVVLMDESHHYRGDASAKALASLRPLLGLEFTATPRTDNKKPFRNIIYRYDLARGVAESIRASAAIAEGRSTDRGYMKIPVIIARSDDHSLKGDIEENKLLDGLTKHSELKARLIEYCDARSLPPLLPVVLITTPTITAANALEERIDSDDFMDGRFRNRVVNTNSGLKGKAYDEQVARLLRLESDSNTYEVVIHVEQLKEGWDVRNVYTIIPFRASISKTLIEQTVGRGLRLPFGKLTGDHDLDRLRIVSHQRFKELLDELGPNPLGELEASDFDPGKPKVKYVDRSFAPRVEQGSFPRIPVLRYQPVVTSGPKSAKGILDGFRPSPTLSDLPDIQRSLIEQDLSTGAVRDLGGIRRPDGFHPVWHIVRLLDKVAEVDLETDKDDLGAIVRQYFTELTGATDEAAWIEPSDDFDGSITEDIAGQLKRHVTSHAEFAYADTGKFVEWRPFTKAMREEVSPLLWRSSSDLRGNVFTGYSKSLFEVCAFDTSPEKEFADLCEQDDEVRAFIRLPINQFPVKLRSGNYNPDFVVLFEDEARYVVETKKRADIENKDTDVAHKARAAAIWCESAQKLGHGEWQYKLYAHDSIEGVSKVRAIPPVTIKK